MRTAPLALATLASLGAACTRWPENAPLSRHDPAAGYRLENVRLERWARAEKGRSAYLAEVSFEGVGDPAERAYFRGLPTSFQLEPEQVDRLREIGGRLLRGSPDFVRLRSDLR
jgi:hypothetical protein